MSAKKFRFKPLDFVNLFPFLEQKALRAECAQNANALLEEQEKKCVRVYGIYSDMSERVDVWQPEKDVCSDSTALLWNEEEINSSAGGKGGVGKIVGHEDGVPIVSPIEEGGE